MQRPHLNNSIWGGVLAVLLCSAAAAQPVEYTVTMQGAVAGRMLVDAKPDGRVSVDFSYRNNGRGPDILESFALGALGAPMAYEGTGRSTMGAEIKERFAVAAGRLAWLSRVDQGDEAIAESTLFLPLEPTPAYGVQVLQSLIQRSERVAPVVGGHRLAAEKVATLALPGPSGPVAAALWMLTGADSEPWYYWLRDDASHALLGLVYPGWELVLKGHESLGAAMLDRQNKAQDERLVALQRRLAQPLPGTTLISNVRWFDAHATAMRGPSDVWLHGGRIAAVTPPGALRTRPDQVIDGSARTLLPGLFDMHVHAWSGQGLYNVAAGVTSVRSMGGDNAEVARLKGRIDRGEVAGPTVYPAGFIEGKSPFSARYGFVVDSLQEALEAVDWYAVRGYRQIKLYNSIRPEWVKPLTAHAHRRGLVVAGHVPAFMRAEEVVRAGYDELTHINQVMLNFVVRDGDDTRTLARFTRVGEDGKRLDLAGPRVRAFLALLRKHRTTVDPTLGAFEAMFNQQQGQPNPSWVDVAEHLPAVWRRSLKVAEMDLEGDRLTSYRRSYERILDLTAAMHRAGVPLVAGTDGFAGLGLHRELALYVRAGIPPLQVLRIATLNGARVAGADHLAGSIEPGKAADLVLIDGDPSQRIADLRRASLVFKGGVAYAPAQIYEALGFKPFVDAVRLESSAATSR